MSIEENKSIARRYIEDLWGKGNLALLDHLISEIFINHSPALNESPGVDGINERIDAFHNAFSYLEFIIEDLVSEEDKIAIRGLFQGIHTGEFMGAPPTGQQVIMTWIIILRIEDGKITDRWANMDDLGLMSQLGSFP